MGSFSDLKVLIALSHKNSSEIILELLVKLDDFSDFLKFKVELDGIEPTIMILSKVCSYPLRSIKFTILQVAVKSRFLLEIEKYVNCVVEKDRKEQIDNEDYRNNKIEFAANLVLVYKSILEIFPIDFVDILQTLFCIVGYLENSRKISPEKSRKVIRNINILITKLHLPKQQLQLKEQKITNFRTLTVYPTAEEILSSNILFNIKNFTKVKYENVEHYLEVQFKLLKLSFVEPFRQEIARYIEHTMSRRGLFKSLLIRIYPDAVFQSIIFECDKGRAILNFSKPDTVKEIFSPHSNCINLDVILCFTKDNFSSVLIGRVIKKNYEKQHLMIDFDQKMGCFEFNVSYTVVEYNVDFQETYFALKALQCMSEADFPMRKYLIYAIPQAERPDYLIPNSSAYYTIQDRTVDILSNIWPTSEDLKLDTTQFAAFRAALTQKFVMIEGAHGTGKTFLGLTIVKTLLKNHLYWYNETPILIVCLSNQVLDTFLEGLITTTDRIIRVGKTKSEKLLNYTLDSARIRNSGIISNLTFNQKNYSNCLNHITDIDNIIINVKYFENIDDNLKISWFFQASAEDYLEWLFHTQDNDPNLMEISEVMKQITEEEKRIASENENTAFNRNNYPEPLGFVLFWKPFQWFDLVSTINEMQKVDNGTDEMKNLEKKLKYLWRNYQYFNIKMIGRQFSPTPTKPINVNYQSPQSMNPHDRWNLYFYWLNLYKIYVEKQYHDLFTKIENIRDPDIMKRALILGMTMNTAAKMRTILQAINCRIVMVHEASDVLESHTVLSITEPCDHLILMGNQEVTINYDKNDSVHDPYRLSDDGASMMKRMMYFNVRCVTLRFQRRIRPKICQLTAPFVDPKIRNHHSITKYPAILGILHCRFFVNHKHQPNQVNFFEAKFLINFAHYLRQLGYAPEDIAILALESGQVEVLCEEIKKYEHVLHGIKICTVETFKGEECKIILLSLVINNEEKTLVSLKSEKFIILALSRAREALYMIGDRELLCQHSKVWQKIDNILLDQKLIADYLPVYSCNINSQHLLKINHPEDFHQPSKNACGKLCVKLAKCEQSCCKKCHRRY